MKLRDLHLLALPAFEDNYFWLLHDGQSALVVDPGDAAPVQQALIHKGLKLDTILVTHHHGDHVGGLKSLMQSPELHASNGVTIHAPALETQAIQAHCQVPLHPVAGGDAILALGLRFEVLDLPGHTRGHVGYFAQAHDRTPLLFCGDTLFSAGCGRLFEGTAAQMWQSLQKLQALPGETQVCSAHEYTLSNLQFAKVVEPDNPDIAKHEVHCTQLRQQHQATLPSSLAQERRINPFLRSEIATVQKVALSQGDPDPDLLQADRALQTFAALRRWKDHFK